MNNWMLMCSTNVKGKCMKFASLKCMQLYCKISSSFSNQYSLLSCSTHNFSKLIPFQLRIWRHLNIIFLLYAVDLVCKLLGNKISQPVKCELKTMIEWKRAAISNNTNNGFILFMCSSESCLELVCIISGSWQWNWNGMQQRSTLLNTPVFDKETVY